MFEDLVFNTVLAEPLTALTIGTIAAGLASAIGGIFSTKSTNTSNKEVMREQNAWNLKQWERERDYNTQIWNMTNEYNTPVNQVQRLRDAGVNPYMAMSGIGGSASAASQPATPAGQSAAGMEYMTPDYSKFSSALNDALAVSANYDSTVANADYLKQHTLNETAETLEKLQQMRIQGDLSKSQKAFIDQQNKELMASFEYNVGSKKAQMEVEQANKRFIDQQVNTSKAQEALYNSQIGLNDAQKDSVATITAQSWIRLRDDLQNSASQRGLNASQVSVNGQYLRNLVEDMYNTAADTSIKRLDRNQKAKAMKFSVDYIEAQAKDMQWIADNPWKSRLLPGVSSAVGGAAGALVGSRSGKMSFGKTRKIGFK